MSTWQEISLTHPKLAREGAVSVEHTSQGSRAWRIPYAERQLYPARLRERAQMPAGVRLCFRSNIRSLGLHYTAEPDTGQLDIVIDGEHTHMLELASHQLSVSALPAGDKAIELWPSQSSALTLERLYLYLSPGASLDASHPAGKRWVAYGSSITQGHKKENHEHPHHPHRRSRARPLRPRHPRHRAGAPRDPG